MTAETGKVQLSDSNREIFTLIRDQTRGTGDGSTTLDKQKVDEYYNGLK